MAQTESDFVLVGQVRRAPHTGRHMVVMWIQGARVLVGRNSNPENDLAWDTIDNIRGWTLLRTRGRRAGEGGS